MTSMLQPVDRHVGVRYKVAVHMAIRKEVTKRLTEARIANGGNAEGVAVKRLTPRETRIIITHAVGECHDKLSESDAFERACVATGTWMPINHCVGKDGPSNHLEDFDVKIQHLKEYKYPIECSRDSCIRVSLDWSGYFGKEERDIALRSPGTEGSKQ